MQLSSEFLAFPGNNLLKVLSVNIFPSANFVFEHLYRLRLNVWELDFSYVAYSLECLIYAAKELLRCHLIPTIILQLIQVKQACLVLTLQLLRQTANTQYQQTGQELDNFDFPGRSYGFGEVNMQWISAN